MESSQSLPERIALAQDTAKAIEARIVELHGANDPEGAQAATKSLEEMMVDLFSTFEARLQHHFKRGPFSRKLKTRLIDAGQTDLADKLYQFYLAINVLKHGKGASHRKLLALSHPLIAVRSAEIGDIKPRSPSLIDVTSHGFSERLCATLIDGYHFLEAQ